MKPIIIFLATAMTIFSTFCDDSSSSHEQAAHELLRLMNTETRWQELERTIFDVQVKVNPSLAQFRDIVEQFTGKYMTWQAVEPRFVKIYMDTFSEREIREIIAFARTPTGQKWWAAMPRLSQSASVIGLEVVKEHHAQLDAMVKERERQLQTNKTQP